MEQVTNGYVLITGATSGIGYELARMFAKDGYSLVIVARTQQDLEHTANELSDQFGVEVIPIAKDLFVPSAPFELYEEVRSRGIQVGILVNDAGQGQYGKFLDADIRRHLDIIQLNIASLTALTYLFLKDMVARNEGKILQLASIASEVPGPLHAVYHATKAYVLSFSEAVNNEIKDTNVSMTALLPGAADTDFFNKADMQNSKVVQKGNLDDPEKAAKDGYEALMKGDDKVVSGLKNKAQVLMSKMMPDKMNADMMRKQQEEMNK